VTAAHTGAGFAPLLAVLLGSVATYVDATDAIRRLLAR
jgi:hypothetical protein